MDAAFDPDKFIERIGQRLVTEFAGARTATTPGTVGSAMEEPVRGQLEQILPRGLAVGSGFVIDSYGGTSKQTDIVIYERDICPIFSINKTAGTEYYPCECVVAVGEVKGAVDHGKLKDAFEKIASVKQLRRRAVHDLRPHPQTGQPIRAYRSYSNLHTDTAIHFGENPRALGEIFGFVLAGEIGVDPERLARRFLDLTHSTGDDLSPNLLVALDGTSLSWGAVTDERQPEVRKNKDGVYSRIVEHGGPPVYKPEWSALSDGILRLDRGDDGIRRLVRGLRAIHLCGRTSPAQALDHYFAAREPRQVDARIYSRSGVEIPAG